MIPHRLARGLGEWWRFLRLHGRSSLLEAGVPPAGGGAGPPGLVVTLTTLPGRIGKIFPTLDSLLDQTVMPERIFLALPPFSLRERKAYAVPEGLRNHSVVTLLAAERDWGPATKLIPALRHFATAPDTPLLAVDDDNIYPRTFIETFRRFAGALPEAALSLRGWPIPPSRRWKDSRAFKGTQLRAPVETDVITGCGGILVRPRFFDGGFFDYGKAPAEAFFVDDLWISGHLARRGVPKYVLPFSGPFVYLPSLATLRGPALDRDENRSGRNNDALIDHFGACWASRPVPRGPKGPAGGPRR
jgi:hypothetical protein